MIEIQSVLYDSPKEMLNEYPLLFKYGAVIKQYDSYDALYVDIKDLKELDSLANEIGKEIIFHPSGDYYSWLLIFDDYL